MNAIHSRKILAAFRFLLVCCAMEAVGAADCNRNGTDDAEEIAAGLVPDCNSNGIPDACELQSDLRLEAPENYWIEEWLGNTILEDLDGDGRPDAAIAGASGVSILINRGNGRFRPWERYEGMGGFVVGGDLDSDGDVDLVCRSMDSVVVLLNSGDGTFSSQEFAAACREALDLADVDGDGDKDILTAGSCLQVIENLGAGKFQVRGGNVNISGDARAMSSGDLDGDGDVDLAVAISGKVSVLRNSGTGSFEAPESYDAGNGPSWLFLCDVDRDGDLDVGVTDATDDALSIYPNKGDGTLAAPVVEYFDYHPSCSIPADVDGDGFPELAIAGYEYQLDIVSIQKNDGAGHFTPIGQFTAGEIPVGLAAGDIDQDGHVDVVATNRSSGTISVHWNLGSGSFADVPRLDWPQGPQLAVAGDLDRDGDADLVVVDVTNKITVMRNEGGLDFTSTAEFQLSGKCTYVDVPLADLDGDGDLDFVYANVEANNVSVFLSSGAASFQAPRNYGTATPRSVAVADLDGDGKLDLAVSEPLSHQVSLYRNRGDGTFEGGGRIEVGATVYASRLAAADFDGDGRCDLAGTISPPGQIGFSQVAVWKNRGDWAFSDPVSTPGIADMYHLIAADLDGDGDPDLAASSATVPRVAVLLNGGQGASWTLDSFSIGLGAITSYVILSAGDLDADGDIDLSGAPYRSRVAFSLLNDGHGRFRDAHLHGVGAGSGFASLGDLDGDGRADLTVANLGEDLSFLLNASVPPLDDCDANDIPDVCDLAPVFALRQTESHATGASPAAPAALDVDGDGDLDLAVAGVDSSDIRLFIHQGDGTFAPGTTISLAEPASDLRAADFDGDRRLDLVAAVPHQKKAVVFLARGDGSFSATLGANAGTGVVSLATGDLDGDGDIDLAVTRPDFPRAGNVTVLLNRGDGTFEAPVDHAADMETERVAAWDFDGDGDLDLAATDLFADQVLLYTNLGAGSFSPMERVPVGNGPAALAVADVNADGRADLVVGNRASHDVSVLIASGSTPAPAVNHPSTDGTPQDEVNSLSVADMDGDGRVDILVFAGKGMALLFGKEAGAFTPAARFGVASGSGTAGDWDADGDLDAATTSGTDSMLRIYRNQPEPTHADCNGNGIPDACEMAHNDCNGNGVLDSCDIAAGRSADCNGNGIPDECEARARVEFTGPEYVPHDFENIPQPRLLLSVDLDGDGQLELVMADVRGRDLVVFEGDGAGTFSEHGRIEIGSGPEALAAGDIDFDGHTDLIAGLGGEFKVAVLTNTGPGRTPVVRKFAVQTYPGSVGLADLDGDGDLDIVVARRPDAFGTSAVDTFQRTSSGDFILQKTLALHGMPISVALADWSGDGRVDIATACQDSPSDKIWIHWNEGDFVFSSQGFLEVPAWQVLAADLENDSFPDLIVCGPDASNDWMVHVLPNQQGSFLAPVKYPVPAQAMVVEDFDGDLDLDLAIVTREPGSVAVLANAGNGLLEEAWRSDLDIWPYSMVAGDFDADGKADLGAMATESIAILLNRTLPPLSPDCNANGVLDACEGTFADCNENGIPDGCELDCNSNGTPDECDIRDGTSKDCDENGVPDECQPDCNRNGTPDSCELATGGVADCNANGIPDSCEVALTDCNGNGIPDSCDAASSDATDCNGNGIPDECDLASGVAQDCNGNAVSDACDISAGTSKDLDGSGIPDECEGGLQRPGDMNQDGKSDLSDAIWILEHLFIGRHPKLPCEGGTASSPGAGELALADVNGDGKIDLSDPVGILMFLFLGSRPPALGTECVRILGCPDKCQ